VTLRRVLVPLLFLTGVSFAQEVSPTVGPSYLLPNANPLFLRPITTPSMSLSGETLAGTSAVPLPMQVPEFASPSTYAYLNNVYWGEHPPTEIFGRRIETPNMTPDQTAWYMNAVENGTPLPMAPFPESAAVAALESPEPPASVIELTGGPIPTNLPESIFDQGVTGEINQQWLLQRGYGISLGEVSAYWKTHKEQAPHVFTNQDLRHK
jgi:hypothetical protein